MNVNESKKDKFYADSASASSGTSGTSAAADSRSNSASPDTSGSSRAAKASDSSGSSAGPSGRRLRIVRILLYVLCCLLAGAGFLIILRNITNTAFLNNYERGSYSEMPESLLLPLRFGDNYVVPYNMGNVEYHLGNYDKAVSYYQDALSSGVPGHNLTENTEPERHEECKIRVNLALSMCHTIDFDTFDRSDDEAVAKAVQTLQEARSVLTARECASEAAGSNDGHFADADLLKHDIDDMLKKLQTPPQSQDQQKKKQNDDQKQKDDQNQNNNQNKSDQEESDSEEKKQEQARQDELKRQLDQQKKDLENANSGSGENGFKYIEGGSTSGYGDGTLW